jgi:hypothetical protein
MQQYRGHYSETILYDEMGVDEDMSGGSVEVGGGQTSHIRRPKFTDLRRLYSLQRHKSASPRACLNMVRNESHHKVHLESPTNLNLNNPWNLGRRQINTCEPVVIDWSTSSSDKKTPSPEYIRRSPPHGRYSPPREVKEGGYNNDEDDGKSTGSSPSLESQSHSDNNNRRAQHSPVRTVIFNDAYMGPYRPEVLRRQELLRIMREYIDALWSCITSFCVSFYRTPIVRVFMFFCIFAAAIFYVHKFVQYQYFHHCQSNVFRVLFYKQSRMCSTMHQVLNVMEDAFLHSSDHVMRQRIMPLFARMLQRVLGFKLWPFDRRGLHPIP